MNKRPKTYKGYYYFPRYEDARDYAKEHVPEHFKIVSYGRGWAIQLRCSGPYVGPEEGFGYEGRLTTN